MMTSKGKLKSRYKENSILESIRQENLADPDLRELQEKVDKGETTEFKEGIAYYPNSRVTLEALEQGWSPRPHCVQRLNCEWVFIWLDEDETRKSKRDLYRRRCKHDKKNKK